MTTLRNAATVLSIAAMLTAMTACGGPADTAGALLAIVPASAEVGPGESLKFETDPDAEAVGWSVLEPEGGLIDDKGLYTAPDAEGTYTVAVWSMTGEQTTSVRVKRNVRVDVLPDTATLAAGGALQFAASVSGGNDKTVTWSVAEGAAGGSITNAGVYTAPSTAGTYNIVATSAADPTKSDRSSITVAAAAQPAPAPTVSVAVSPQSSSVVAGTNVQLAATVSGTTDTSVTWSVAQTGGGTVTSTGLYTAPATAGTYHVKATSRADATKSATATMTVTAPVVSKPAISAFTASPSSITQGASSTLAWTVSGATSLTLSDVGAVTGTSSRSVSPTATTTYTLTATNAAGSTTATATVSVSAPPTTTPTTGKTIADCTGLVSHSNALAQQPLSRPGYLQSVIDPAFKTKITRVTGDPGTAIPNPFNDPSITGKLWANEPAGPTYAKDSHWNADGSLLVIKRGAPGNLFVDGNTYQPRFWRSRGRTGFADWRWHPKNPSLGVYVKANGEVGYWDVKADTETMKLAGQGLSGCRMGDGEGNVSDDGRFVVVQCGTSFYAVDLVNSVKYPTITAAQVGLSNLDWASISPKGTRVIASQNSSLSKSAPLSLSMTGAQFSAAFSSGHYDVSVAPDGSEVAYESGVPKIVNLATGAVTSIGTSIRAGQYHGSTRNTAAPGWGYGSLESTGGALVGEIVAHELKAGGRIRRIAHHRTNLTSNGTQPTYERMVFGVSSTDGMQVFFRSDWGNATGQISGFVVDTRNVCP